MNDPAALILLQYFLDQAYLTEQKDEKDWPGYHAHLPDVTKEAIPKNVACVYDTSGALDGRLMDGPVIRHPGIQVRVRAKDYLIGWRKIEELRVAMTTVRRELVTITDPATMVESVYRIEAITLTGDIAVMGQRDKTRRDEFTQNATMTITEV